jgi:hypothetical protein
VGSEWQTSWLLTVTVRDDAAFRCVSELHNQSAIKKKASGILEFAWFDKTIKITLTRDPFVESMDFQSNRASGKAKMTEPIRRDAEAAAAAQAGRQGRAGCPHQPAPRTQTRRHCLPLSHSAPGGGVVIGQSASIWLSSVAS